MEKVSKLQKLLPYDWRIVNELKRDLTADEYAVAVSWLANFSISLDKRDRFYLGRYFVNISKDTQLDFLNFAGWGDEKVKTIYINKCSKKRTANDYYYGKESAKRITKLDGVK
jgi:hypothetical protein